MTTVLLIAFGAFCGSIFAQRKLGRMNARRAARRGEGPRSEQGGFLAIATITLYGAIGASVGGLIDLAFKLS